MCDSPGCHGQAERKAPTHSHLQLLVLSPTPPPARQDALQQEGCAHLLPSPGCDPPSLAGVRCRRQRQQPLCPQRPLLTITLLFPSEPELNFRILLNPATDNRAEREARGRSLSSPCFCTLHHTRSRRCCVHAEGQVGWDSLLGAVPALRWAPRARGPSHGLEGSQLPCLQERPARSADPHTVNAPLTKQERPFRQESKSL